MFLFEREIWQASLLPPGKRVFEYVLKIVGLDEFLEIDYSTKLASLSYVRESVKKRRRIELAIVDQSTLDGSFSKRGHLIDDNQWTATYRLNDLVTQPIQCFPSQMVEKSFDCRLLGLEYSLPPSVLGKFDKTDLESGRLSAYVSLPYDQI